MPIDDASLSIYIHIPFCSVRCSYCAFNTYTDLEHLVPAYVESLCRELELVSASNPHKDVHTVYFGGGTPSLLRSGQFERILDLLGRQFPLSGDAEISLEANPDDLDVAYLRDLRALGFNRLSLGMQSANANVLRMFDRQHDLQAVAEAMTAARHAGFDNVNLDVIFGSPYETLSDWNVTVETVLGFAPEHVSMYGLELKGGTALRQQVDAGELPRPDDDLFADMYEYASDEMARHGYLQYEISNWCLSGGECQHNLQYWRNLDYIGVGAGAHGFAGGYRYSTVAAPARYIASLSGRDEQHDMPFPFTSAVAKSTAVSRADDLYETIMMTLRLTREGIGRACFERRFGQDFAEMFPVGVAKMAGLGLLELTSERVCLSAAGRLLSNTVIREFVESIPISD